MLKHKIIGRNVSILYRHENNFIDRKIKEFNLNKVQVEVLLFLVDNPGSNLKEINSFFKFNKATITKIVKHLEQEGYVTSTINSVDKREKNITITYRADDLLASVKEHFIGWELAALKGISPKEIEVTRNVLAQMVSNLAEMSEE